MGTWRRCANCGAEATVRVVGRCHFGLSIMGARMRSCAQCGSPYLGKVRFCGIDGGEVHEVEDDSLIGREVDRYRIEGLLGIGGMSRVYRARHAVLGRPYALKILYGDYSSDTAMVERFCREARVAGKIRHENVVTVLDAGSTPEGLTFLAMDLAEGETLREIVRSGGLLGALERIAGITRQLACGLSEIHAHDFIHRDLKPSNIVVDEAEDGSDRIKILDLGISKLLRHQTAMIDLTREGQFVGTPVYTAPEQIYGEALSPATDLYSLGITLFEMLEGKPPFAGRGTDLYCLHRSAPVPRMAEAGGLDQLTADLLQKDPAARPQSALEVVARVDRIVAGLRQQAKPHQAVAVIDALLETEASVGSTDAAVGVASEALAPAAPPRLPSATLLALPGGAGDFGGEAGATEALKENPLAVHLRKKAATASKPPRAAPPSVPVAILRAVRSFTGLGRAELAPARRASRRRNFGFAAVAAGVLVVGAGILLSGRSAPADADAPAVAVAKAVPSRVLRDAPAERRLSQVTPPKATAVLTTRAQVRAESRPARALASGRSSARRTQRAPKPTSRAAVAEAPSSAPARPVPPKTRLERLGVRLHELAGTLSPRSLRALEGAYIELAQKMLKNPDTPRAWARDLDRLERRVRAASPP